MSLKKRLYETIATVFSDAALTETKTLLWVGLLRPSQEGCVIIMTRVLRTRPWKTDLETFLEYYNTKQDYDAGLSLDPCLWTLWVLNINRTCLVCQLVEASSKWVSGVEPRLVGWRQREWMTAVILWPPQFESATATFSISDWNSKVYTYWEFQTLTTVWKALGWKGFRSLN